MNKKDEQKIKKVIEGVDYLKSRCLGIRDRDLVDIMLGRQPSPLSLKDRINALEEKMDLLLKHLDVEVIEKPAIQASKYLKKKPKK